MLTLAINSVRVREYPLTCKQSWDNGTVSHDCYHALLPKLAGKSHQILLKNRKGVIYCTRMHGEYCY